MEGNNLPAVVPARKVKKHSYTRVVPVAIPVAVHYPKHPSDAPNYVQRQALPVSCCANCDHGWKTGVLGVVDVYCNRDNSCPVGRDDFACLQAVYKDAETAGQASRWEADRRARNLRVHPNGYCDAFKPEPVKVEEKCRKSIDCQKKGRPKLPA